MGERRESGGAERLIQLVGALREAAGAGEGSKFFEIARDQAQGELQPLGETRHYWRFDPRLSQALTEMGALLEAAGEDALPPGWEGGRSILLGAARIDFEPRKTHRSWLQPTLFVPIVQLVPDNVAFYLIRTGEDDLLERENHGSWGYHYHYLTAKKDRTDIIICWDTRWQAQIPVSAAARPLFWELHAEGKAQADAFPERWSDRRRAAMHKACRPDLCTWTIDKFKPASNDASAVWPRVAVLSPLPPPPALARPRFPSKNGRRRSR